ncbi:MAG: hypothetical protein AABZ33_06330 [Chloroflexota bacterium]
MPRRSRRFLLLALAAASLAACAPAPTTTLTDTLLQTASPTDAPSDSPSVATTVPDAANGISFERPVQWTRWQPNQHNPINDGPLIYLSTDPVLAACATAADATANPPDAQGRACAWPLTSLSANGVFVNWLTSRILDPRPSAGEAIAMNGENARLQTERPGSCAKIGADETISVWVPIGQPTPLSNVWVVACLRGPDLATTEAQLRAMLASAVLGK